MLTCPWQQTEERVLRFTHGFQKTMLVIYVMYILMCDRSIGGLYHQIRITCYQYTSNTKTK